MSDALNQSLAEERYENKYAEYLHKLVLFLQHDSVGNEINLLDALNEIAKMQPTPLFIRSQTRRWAELLANKKEVWDVLNTDILQNNNENTKVIFKKLYDSRNFFDRK